MAILKETTVTAKSVQEAFEQGKLELGVTETDDVQFEIIQQEAKKLFRSVPAIVRVYVEGEDPAPVKEEKKPAAKKETKPAAPKKEKKAEKPAPKQAEEAPVAEEEACVEEEASAKEPLIAVSEEEYLPQVKNAVSLLTKILKEMDLEGLTFEVSQNEKEAQISISGENASYLIGRRGETMSALQYLVSLAVNRKKDEYFRVMLNVENYREKRESTLTALALRMAKNAVRTGRSTTLEPMNPYERRIIHSTVQKVEGATSSSVGEEPARRVVIRSVSGKPSSGKGGHGRRDDRKGKGGHGRRDDRPRKSTYVAPTDENGQKREPKSDVDFGSLYGKIEL